MNGWLFPGLLKCASMSASASASAVLSSNISRSDHSRLFSKAAVPFGPPVFRPRFPLPTIVLCHADGQCGRPFRR